VTPLVRPNAPMWQSKIDHAQNWQALADRTVTNFSKTQHAELPKVYVAMGPSDMQFAAIYRRYLEQALIKRGYSVVESSADAVVLNSEVQTFLYGDNGGDKKLFDYHTFWTSLADVGYGISTINTVDGGLWTVGVAGPAFDFLDSLNRTTQAEVTVTTSVSDASRLYYTDTESFYVKPSDLPFYWTAQRPDSPQVMPGAALATVEIPVRGEYR
jgi:hypothetical protein